MTMETFFSFFLENCGTHVMKEDDANSKNVLNRWEKVLWLLQHDTLSSIWQEGPGLVKTFNGTPVKDGAYQEVAVEPCKQGVTINYLRIQCAHECTAIQNQRQACWRQVCRDSELPVTCAHTRNRAESLQSSSSTSRKLDMYKWQDVRRSNGNKETLVRWLDELTQQISVLSNTG